MTTNTAPKIFARHVYALLIGMGVASTIAIMSILFLLTARIDKQSTASTQTKIGIVLEEWSEALLSATEDSAYWTEAYDVVKARNGAAVYSYLGSSAAESDVFDWMLIVSTDGKLLYEYDVPPEWSAIDFLASREGTNLLKKVRENTPDQYISVKDPISFKGSAALTTTAWITPDDTTGLDVADYSILITGRNLGVGTLSKMETLTGANGLVFLHGNSDVAENAVLLNGSLGKIGKLSWSPSNPGSSFRQDMLPWLSLLCLAITLATSWVARNFRKMLDGLNKAEIEARTDELTGVPNRLGLYTVLQSPWLEDVLAQGEFALLSIDLNDFKVLNDQRGHNAGDVALKITASWLKRSLRRGDYVIRMGGDEFVCLIVDPDPKTAATSASNRIVEKFKTPMEYKGATFVVRPSIGVAIGKQGEEWETLLERSDKAMYWAKTNGTALHFDDVDENTTVEFAA